MTETRLRGRVWRFGDDVNTDLIIPGKYLELVDPDEMALHAMEGIDPKFPERVREGDIVVGGANFGCGSSREHAPLALKHAGVGAVVAEGFARIFYRNAINLGLPALQCPGISGKAETGQVIEIDMTRGTIKNEDTGEELGFTPLPAFMQDILSAGGLAQHLREHVEEW